VLDDNNTHIIIEYVCLLGITGLFSKIERSKVK
jgi:hypothetical protein